MEIEDLELASFLLRHNVDVNVVDKDGNNCLHLLLHSLPKIIKMRPSALHHTIQALLDKGINTNLLNRNNESPLHIACEKHLTNIACLIAANTSIF
jgi:ankyrin repeat protein